MDGKKKASNMEIISIGNVHLNSKMEQNNDNDKVTETEENGCNESCMAGFQEFAYGTTFHGVRNLSQKGISMIRRGIWLFLLIAITTFSLGIIGASLHKYLHYDSVASIYQRIHSEQDFPTLLFCNFNMIRR